MGKTWNRRRGRRPIRQSRQRSTGPNGPVFRLTGQRLSALASAADAPRGPFQSSIPSAFESLGLFARRIRQRSGVLTDGGRACLAQPRRLIDFGRPILCLRCLSGDAQDENGSERQNFHCLAPYREPSRLAEAGCIRDSSSGGRALPRRARPGTQKSHVRTRIVRHSH
jgi:hypothetical protein